MGYNRNEIEIGDILRYKLTNTYHIVKNIKRWNKGLGYKISISPSLYYAYNGEFIHEYWNDSYIDNGMVKL